MVRVGILVMAMTAALSGVAMAQDTPVGRARDDGAPPTVAPPAAPPPSSAPATHEVNTTPPASPTSADPTGDQINAWLKASPSAAAPRDGATTPPASPTSSDPTGDQIAAWLKADNSGVQPLDSAPLTAAPRQIHGEVSATISNRGYGGSAAVSMPLGQASELDVAVGAAHVRTPWGNRNPKSVAVGLYLDGGDVANWLSRDKCKTPRWGVRLKDDPEVLPDGSCVRTDAGATRDAAR